MSRMIPVFSSTSDGGMRKTFLGAFHALSQGRDSLTLRGLSPWDGFAAMMEGNRVTWGEGPQYCIRANLTHCFCLR